MINKEKIRTKSFPNRQREKGITLIVVLVILTAMTFLGVGAMKDSNMQLAMVRNSQLANMSYSAAMTEINAQIDLINDPATGMNDLAVIAVVNAAPQDANGDGIVLETHITDADPALNSLAADILSDAGVDTARLTQELTLTQPDPDLRPVSAGFSIDPNSGFRWRLLELNSTVTIENTSSGSDQTQGIRYLGAN